MLLTPSAVNPTKCSHGKPARPSPAPRKSRNTHPTAPVAILVIFPTHNQVFSSLAVCSSVLSIAPATIQKHIRTGKPDRQGRFYDYAFTVNDYAFTVNDYAFTVNDYAFTVNNDAIQENANA